MKCLKSTRFAASLFVILLPFWSAGCNEAFFDLLGSIAEAERLIVIDDGNVEEALIQCPPDLGQEPYNCDLRFLRIDRDGVRASARLMGDNQVELSSLRIDFPEYLVLADAEQAIYDSNFSESATTLSIESINDERIRGVITGRVDQVRVAFLGTSRQNCVSDDMVGLCAMDFERNLPFRIEFDVAIEVLPPGTPYRP